MNSNTSSNLKDTLYDCKKKLYNIVTISSGLGLKEKNTKGQFSARGLTVLSYLSLMQLRYNWRASEASETLSGLFN